MTLQDHVAAALQDNLEMLKTTLADFSDTDMLVRPVSNANHAAWQVGHVICSETRMIEASKIGCMPSLPAGFADRFTKDTAKLDTPTAFPKKAELLEVYARQRQGTIAWARALSPDNLNTPMPEPLRHFIPTVAALLLLAPTHLAMHLGQIQVIRRKLNKPVLF